MVNIAQRAALLNEKGTKELEERCEEIIQHLKLAQNAMNNRKRELDLAKDRLAIEDARLFADATGSNAEKRKAAALASRLEDAGYYNAYQEVSNVQTAYDEAVEAFDALKREFSLKSNIIALRTAQIGFLGG